ncbi:hypothetical protein AVEN_190285-1 [Araneus ventricosus]|uniref:Uncharacterized protein n=1 Tax=Araneus ventricosus TaxID=182803 RepID=A0A4Y2JK17_ARAVE|nr:hypothetical protein AVEN_190285-1 [Araneus ventricosus]
MWRDTIVYPSVHAWEDLRSISAKYLHSACFRFEVAPDLILYDRPSHMAGVLADLRGIKKKYFQDCFVAITRFRAIDDRLKNVAGTSCWGLSKKHQKTAVSLRGGGKRSFLYAPAARGPQHQAQQRPQSSIQRKFLPQYHRGEQHHPNDILQVTEDASSH